MRMHQRHVLCSVFLATGLVECREGFVVRRDSLQSQQVRLDDNAFAARRKRGNLGIASTRIFFDIEIDKEPLGRLIFCLPDASMFPKHSENVVKLCTGERRSIDPLCSYKGCAFQFSPQYLETRAQYRWAHVLPGRGRNAVGPADGRIADAEALRKYTQTVYGGIYYGLTYDSIPDKDNAVLLTLPMTGPGRGSTLVSFVRVGESPREWKQRLLMNSMVIGWLEAPCYDVLRRMARQERAPPVVANAGVLLDEQDRV